MLEKPAQKWGKCYWILLSMNFSRLLQKWTFVKIRKEVGPKLRPLSRAHIKARKPTENMFWGQNRCSFHGRSYPDGHLKNYIFLWSLLAGILYVVFLLLAVIRQIYDSNVLWINITNGKLFHRDTGSGRGIERFINEHY